MSTEERDEMQPRPRKAMHNDQEGERRPYSQDYNKPEGGYERRPYRSYGETNRPAYGDRQSRQGGYGNSGDGSREGDESRPRG